MSAPKLYIVRGMYGEVIAASFHPEMLADASIGRSVTHRYIKNTKQLAAAMLQSGSSKRLIDSAWRMAVKHGAVDPSHTFKYGDSLGIQTVEYAKQESFQLDFYIGQLVNNPNSRFYIYG